MKQDYQKIAEILKSKSDFEIKEMVKNLEFFENYEFEILRSSILKLSKADEIEDESLRDEIIHLEDQIDGLETQIRCATRAFEQMENSLKKYYKEGGISKEILEEVLSFERTCGFERSYY